MSRRLTTLVAGLVAMLLAACSPAAPPTEPRIPTDPALPRPAVVGVNYQPMWEGMTPPARARELDLLERAGVGWVRIDVAWATFQPTGPDRFDPAGVARVDRRIAEAVAHGMKVLLLFYWAPAWSSGTTDRNGRPGDPADYARAAAWVAKRYNGTDPRLRIEAIEFWNEPNLNRFWERYPGDTRVRDFAALVARAGPLVRAVNPQLTRIVGAPSGVGLDWYRQFYAEDWQPGSYDALGIHPYLVPSNLPPDTPGSQASSPDDAMVEIPRLSALMTEKGDPARIWVTEFGWSTHANAPGLQAWQLGVTPVQQASYLVASLPILAATPRVEAAFWYTTRDTEVGDIQFNNFGLLELDYTPKPSYYALRCVLTGSCGTAYRMAK